jgi:TetR/AcrR family transcriptional regulator, mexJK operon transcriptional repressor
MTQLSDAKRDAILDAGTRMFLTRGYTTVSMDAIAEAAPVSKPTLYNYFAGKPALFEAVINRLCERLFRAFDKVEASEGNFSAGLRLIARACVDLVYSDESLQLFRLIIAELSNFPDLGKLAYRCGAEPTIDRIANYLKSADPATGVHFPKVRESARLLISMLMGDDHLRCLVGAKSSLSPRERHALVERVIDIYLRAHSVRG